MNLSIADEYWQNFLKDTGRDPEMRCSGDLCFDAEGIQNDEKLVLITTGKKTATFSTLASFSIDGEPLPVSGEIYMVFDRSGTPRCIIEVDSVNIVPFNEVTWGMAQQEGEDSSLEEWREKEQEYLEYEGQVVGFQFTPDIKLVFQTFNVIYK